MTRLYITGDDPPRVFDLDQAHGLFLAGHELIARYGTAGFPGDDSYLVTLYEDVDAHAELARIVAWLDGDGADPCADERAALCAEADDS